MSAQNNLIMLTYKKILILKIFVLSVLMFSISGCNFKSSKEQNPEASEVLGEVDIPDLPEDAPEKNNIKPPRTKNPPPKKLIDNHLTVPEGIDSELPDFSSYSDIDKKKQDFFNFIKPIVEQENRKVLEERSYILTQLQRVENGDSLSDSELQDLEKIAIRYRVENRDIGSRGFFRDLLLHVDIIPEELALVQAANESAWGSSYFARKGNNLFGQWCFSPGCGVVPRKRMSGATHEVAVFDDLTHSVQSYILYLNSHPAFRQLRVVRYHAREAGQEPSGYDMAIGLQKYSGIGMEYVNTLRSMMQHNLEYMGPKASL